MNSDSFDIQTYMTKGVERVVKRRHEGRLEKSQRKCFSGQIRRGLPNRL